MNSQRISLYILLGHLWNRFLEGKLLIQRIITSVILLEIAETLLLNAMCFYKFCHKRDPETGPIVVIYCYITDNPPNSGLKTPCIISHDCAVWVGLLGNGLSLIHLVGWGSLAGARESKMVLFTYFVPQLQWLEWLDTGWSLNVVSDHPEFHAS